MNFSTAQTTTEEISSPSELSPPDRTPVVKSETHVLDALASERLAEVQELSYHTQPQRVLPQREGILSALGHEDAVRLKQISAPSDATMSHEPVTHELHTLFEGVSQLHASLASQRGRLPWWTGLQSWVYETLPFLSPLFTSKQVRHALDATLKRAKQGLRSGEYLPFQATQILVEDMANWVHQHGVPSTMNWHLFQKHLDQSIRVDWHQRLLQKHMQHRFMAMEGASSQDANEATGSMLEAQRPTSRTLQTVGSKGELVLASQDMTQASLVSTGSVQTAKKNRWSKRPQSLIQAYLAKHAQGVAPIDGWMDGLHALLQEESTCLLHPILVDAYQQVSLEVQVWEKLLKDALPVAQQEAVLLAMLQKLFLPMTRALLEQQQLQSLLSVLYPAQTHRERRTVQENDSDRGTRQKSGRASLQAPSVTWAEYRLVYRLLHWMQKGHSHSVLVEGLATADKHHVDAIIQACFQGELPSSFDALTPPASGRVVLLHWHQLPEETLMMFRHVLLTYQRTQKQTVQSLLRWQAAVILQRENFQTIAAHWWLQTFQQLPHPGLTQFLLYSIKTWIPQLSLPTFQGILQCFTRPHWYGVSVLIANALEGLLASYKTPYQWEKLFRKEATHIGLTYHRPTKTWMRVKSPTSRTANPWFFMPQALAATYVDVLNAWTPSSRSGVSVSSNAHTQRFPYPEAHRALVWSPLPEDELQKAMCEDEPQVIESWLALWLEQWHAGELFSQGGVSTLKRPVWRVSVASHVLSSQLTASQQGVWVTDTLAARQAMYDDFTYQQWLKQWVMHFQEAAEVALSLQRPLVSVIHHGESLFAPFLPAEQTTPEVSLGKNALEQSACYTLNQQAIQRRHQGFIKLLMLLLQKGEAMHPTQPVMLQTHTPILCIVRMPHSVQDAMKLKETAMYLQEPYVYWCQWLQEKTYRAGSATTVDTLFGISSMSSSMSTTLPRFGLSWSTLETQTSHMTQAMQWSLSDLTRYLRWYLESLLVPEAFSVKVLLEWESQLPEHLAQYYYQKQWFLDAIHQHLHTSVLKPIVHHGVKHWHTSSLLRVVLRMNEAFLPVSAPHWSLLPQHAKQYATGQVMESVLEALGDERSDTQAFPSTEGSLSSVKPEVSPDTSATVRHAPTRKYLQPQILTLAWE